MKTHPSKKAPTLQEALAGFGRPGTGNRACFRNRTRQLTTGNGNFSATLRILTVLLSLAAALNLVADNCNTLVSGTVDGEVWTAAGSPYCVTDDVTVSSLIIQPGVEVRFLGNYVFMVTGRLQVKGTSASQVRFTTTNSAVGWQGIWFENGLPGSYFNNCLIENSKNSAVRITNSPPVGGAVPTFTNCFIINNSSPDHGGGIDATLRSGDLVLDHCWIGTNTCGFYGGGIRAILNSGTLKMVHCTNVSNIANVGAANGGSYVGGGLYVSGNSLLLNCWIADNICYSRVTGNFQEQISYGGGVFSDTGTAILRNCRLQRNTAQTIHCCGASVSRAFGGAVCSYTGHLTMQNCIVDTNTCSSASDSSGAGIFVGNGTAGSATADIINCTIIGNNAHGLYGWAGEGTVNCFNSILYFNNSSSDQTGGSVTLSYCDVQGVAGGTGNIDFNPNLRGGTLELLSVSPCIDAGDPDPRYNDACFPPSRGVIDGTMPYLNDMGAYGGPAACCWANPCGPPIITSQPKNLTACINGSAMFCASAIGDEPLRYQWRFHGNNAGNAATNLAGATNACLLISNVQSNQAGYYSVVVANAFGTATSSNALLTVTPVCVDINLYAGLTITGGVTGRVYRVEYVTNLNDTAWMALTTITQEVSGVFVLDPRPANHPQKFYRVVP